MKRWSEAFGKLTTSRQPLLPRPSTSKPLPGLSLYERWSRGRKGAGRQCNLSCLHQSGERGKKKGEGEGKFQGKGRGCWDDFLRTRRREAPNEMNRSLCKIEQALSGLSRTGFSQSKLLSSFRPHQGLSGIGLAVSQTSWSLLITRPGTCCSSSAVHPLTELSKNKGQLGFLPLFTTPPSF